MKKRPARSAKKYRTPEDMQAVIDEYFDDCDNRLMKVYSKKLDDVVEINDPEPYTIEGLCLALDLSRNTLLNYENQPTYEQFHGIIKRAKMRVQKCLVLKSLESNAAGPIFNLKNNFNYKDRQEVTGEDGGPIRFVLSKDDENV